MTKKFKLQGLDCANCAAKVERTVGKIKGVEDSNVDFMTCKMIIDIENDSEELINSIKSAVLKVDKNIIIKEV